MDFARPPLLLLLGLLPLAVAGASLARKRRVAAWVALGGSGRPPTTLHGRWVAALAAMIVGLAGPTLGRVPGSELPPGHDVVLLVDASRSMAAEDVVPNRMGAAVSAAEGLVRELAREPGARVAVVAFAGGVEPLCPLTDRLDAAVERLREIRPGSVRPGGTEIGAAVVAALETFDDQESADGRSIVVFSDGEDLSGTWTTLLPRLKAARVVVHGVTVGDAESGHVIPGGSRGGPLVYRGETVLTRRSDDALTAICKATGGLLIPAGVRRADVGILYRDVISPTERARRVATAPPERADRSSWFIAGSLGLIGSWAWPRSRRIGALAIFLAVGIGAGPPLGSARGNVRLGDAAYRSGDFAGALSLFEGAIQLEPSSPIPRYNAAAARYQLGQFAEAQQLYGEARERADDVLRAKIDYALGNVAVATGRYKESLARYDECLASGADGPAVVAVKRDARANRRYAERLIPPPTTPETDGNQRAPDPKTRPDAPPPNPAPGQGEDGPEAPPQIPPPDGSSGGSSGGRSNPTGGATEPRSGSPEERLGAMLREVRKGQAASREGTEPPPPRSDTDRKDW